MVYFLIPPLLLICGGDPGWWQAWLYGLLIVGLGIGGRMWAELRHPGLIAERQNSENLRRAKACDKVLAPLMAVSFSYPLVIVAGLDHCYAWSTDFPPWLNVVGLIWISLGYAFVSWAVAENRLFYRVALIRTDRGHVVCDSGPYQFVRHPGYAGNVIALPGLVLALDTLWALLPAAAALVVTVTRTALEDRTLQDELPGYRDYARRVRYRLIRDLLKVHAFALAPPRSRSKNQREQEVAAAKLLVEQAAKEESYAHRKQDIAQLDMQQALAEVAATRKAYQDCRKAIRFLGEVLCSPVYPERPRCCHD